LKQVYEGRRIKTATLAQFGLGEPLHVLVVDLTQETKKKPELYARFSALCSTILLVSKSNTTVQGATVLQAPVRLSDLLDAIDKKPVSTAQRISKGVFINMQTLSLIKVCGSKLLETRLTRTECSMLKCLAGGCGRKAVTEKEILKSVFGYSSLASTNTVKTHMCRLRQKIGKTLVKSTNRGYELCLSSDLV
jgi:DNA-binding response OmpR family regulator